MHYTITVPFRSLTFIRLHLLFLLASQIFPSSSSVTTRCFWPVTVQRQPCCLLRSVYCLPPLLSRDPAILSTHTLSPPSSLFSFCQSLAFHIIPLFIHLPFSFFSLWPLSAIQSTAMSVKNTLWTLKHKDVCRHSILYSVLFPPHFYPISLSIQM